MSSVEIQLPIFHILMLSIEIDKKDFVSYSDGQSRGAPSFNGDLDDARASNPEGARASLFGIHAGQQCCFDQHRP